MYSFEEIVGNELIKKSLNKAIKLNRTSHAYIFQGAFGCGKKLIGNSFAKALQCEHKTGCGTCISCKTFESGNNADVFYVVPTKRKTVGVDDIREQVIQEVATKPYQNRYKVFIIDNADKMTVGAQNALLKTLEEPPEYGVFILLAENSQLFLQTILSRCVTLKIQPLSPLYVKKYLMDKKGIGEDEAEFYSQYSGGSIGNALMLKEDEGFSLMRDDIVEKLCVIKETDLATVISWGKELDKYKDSVNKLLDVAYLWFRDLLIFKKLKDEKYIVQKDKKEIILKQAKNTSFGDIEKSLDSIWQAKRSLEQKGNFQLTLEVMLMSIKGV